MLCPAISLIFACVANKTSPTFRFCQINSYNQREGNSRLCSHVLHVSRSPVTFSKYLKCLCHIRKLRHYNNLPEISLWLVMPSAICPYRQMISILLIFFIKVCGLPTKLSGSTKRATKKLSIDISCCIHPKFHYKS